LPPGIWYLLRPVRVPQFDAVPYALVVGLGEGLMGAIVGLVLGVAAWPASTWRAAARSGHLAGIGGSAVVGVFLGWQAAVGICVIAAALWMIVQLVRRLRLPIDLPWLAILAATTLVWIPAWRTSAAKLQLGEISFVGPFAPWYLPAVAAMIVFTCSLVGRRLGDDLQTG
jgi:hypothetical protein